MMSMMPMLKKTTRELQDIVRRFNVKKLEVLEEIASAAMKLSYFPTQWKNADVILLQNSGRSNECPISLFTGLGKVAEKINVNRVKEEVEELHIIPDHQLGFKSEQDTESQICRIATRLVDDLYRKETTEIVLRDVAKAFDRVWQDNLM